MDKGHRIIWIDGLAGATVGVLMLALLKWLISLYQLPANLVLLIGVCNLLYGMYSLSLATYLSRSKGRILFLIVANMIWAVLCFIWVINYWSTASFFGLAHIAAEGIFVGGLAYVEWQWRTKLYESARDSV